MTSPLHPVPPAELEPPRRWTLSHTVERLIGALARSQSDHSSVELTRNARMEVQIRVAVRSGEGGVETVEECAAKAGEVFDELESRYPRATNGD